MNVGLCQLREIFFELHNLRTDPDASVVGGEEICFLFIKSVIDSETELLTRDVF